MTMKSLFVAAGAAAILAGPVPALAQEAHQPAVPAPAPVDAGEVTDTEIAQLASALERVDEVVIQATEQMQAGLDAQGQAALEAQVQEDLIEAVESSGLSIDRYNQLAMAVQTDPELAGRVAASMQ